MNRLKSERLKRKWTQQEIAYRANISVADISRIESGRLKPYPKHEKRLADLLEIPAKELFKDVYKDKKQGGDK